MNYTVTINGQVWQTLSYPDVAPSSYILHEVAVAIDAGQLASFASPDGSWSVQIQQV